MSTPSKVFFSMNIPSIAAGTDDDRHYAHGQAGEWKLTDASWTPSTAVTANDTNFTTYTLKQGANTLASFDTTISGGSLVAGTPVTFSLSGGVNLEFGATDALNLNFADGGSGQIKDGSLSLTFEKTRT